MKTLALFLFFILSFTVTAQIVNIPDPAFKFMLIYEAGIDTNMDGEIQVSEAEAVTGMLDIHIIYPEQIIYDLTGIEAFVNITGLDVWGHQLTTLDLSSNTLLIELYCYNNNLTYLNVENCANLEILQASTNQLTSVDLISNTNLEEVDLYKNQLTYLDIRNSNNTNITEYFDSGNNPNLICIFVDDAEYSENSPIWFKDPASTYVETEAECDALGINDVLLHDTHIFPNPVKDILNFQISYENFPIEISLLDIRGQEILNFHLNNYDTQIDLTYLNSGMYFFVFKDQHTNNLPVVIGTKKLIKL